MIELNCETDFVSRNELLRKLAANIAHTAAFLAEPATDSVNPFQNYQIDAFSDAPLLTNDQSVPNRTSESINDHIRNTVAKMGEKIFLRRAIAISRDAPSSSSGFRVSSYVHGALPDDPRVGRVGTLLDISLKSSNISSISRKPEFGAGLAALERALARQVVGLNAIRTRNPATADGSSVDGEEPETLYNQPFMMHPAFAAESVESALMKWAKQVAVEDIQVNDFVRWKVGEQDIR
jgi:elongation factor Ts